jgi:hypothetical protein
MKLENGMIVTLENGDRVKVNLEKIEEQITELVPGKKYKLRYTGDFCHAFSRSGEITFMDLDGPEFEYIGTVCDGSRDIFYCLGRAAYVMFSNSNLKHIVREIK